MRRFIHTPPFRLFVLHLFLVFALPAQAGFEVRTSDSKIEIIDDGKVVFGWQKRPPENPLGGMEKFPISAYVHPLATPSGFDLTAVQPQDHLHHLGLWWPWKQVTVDGKKYITWELQKGEGRHVAKTAEVTAKENDAVSITADNEVQIRRGGIYESVIAETVTFHFSRLGADAYALDIGIKHEPIDGRVVDITSYRYSGFSWRGPLSWTAENSQMVTSDQRNRTNANGEPARWVFVAGPSTRGEASFLMLSGASHDGNPVERLRVWNQSMHQGHPFINFNPVMKQSYHLAEDHPEVASRRYRVIMADRKIAPAEAEKFWQDWKSVR